MSCPIETHPLYATFRVRTIGVGRNCARGYLLPSEMSLQNRPNFRSNSTGKERDEETGYSYFGARYMDHALLTGWLSVDPMADKYPGISPYNYCMWNPIRVVDPNGMDTIISFDERKPNERDYCSYYKNSYKKYYNEACKRYKKNLKLAQNARRYKNTSDIIHVFAHGLDDVFGFYTGKMLWGNGNKIGPEDLYYILNSRSKTFFENEFNDRGSVIMLHSCKAGQGFAQKFSKLTQNSLIIAPSDNRDILRDVDWEFVENAGDWLFFFNGEMLYRHSGDFFNTSILEKKLEALGTEGVLKLVNENRLEELFKLFK